MFQILKKYVIVKKTVFLGILVFIAVIAFYSFPASAQTITASPQTISVNQNANFSFLLSIGAVSNFFGIGFQLNYDTALLSFQSASEGNLLSQGCSTSFLTAEDPSGIVNVGLTRLGSDCGTVSGPGTIASFNFEALNNAGSSSIIFSNTAISIVDNGQLIQPFPTGTWNSISVTVVASASPVCGDGICNGSEVCSSCAADCGVCTTQPTPGGGGGTPPSIPDSIPPTQPSGYGAMTADKQIILSWKNPVIPDFKGVLIVRKEGSAPASKNDGMIVYQGVAEKYADINLNNTIIYHYGIFAYDAADNYSKISVISVQPMAGIKQNESEIKEPVKTIVSEECPVNITGLYGKAKEIVECVSQEEARMVFGNNMYVSLNDITLPIYKKIIQSDEANIDNKTKYAIAYFIQNGSSATKILGAGERAGVVNSYKSVFNKFPGTEADWQDVIKIANGRWPSERNGQAEEKTKNEIFKKIYLRAANMSNSNDNAAVTVITYGLRPANRNMESEKAGIKIFKAIYARSPESAVDWDIVRAIAYSGAVR